MTDNLNNPDKELEQAYLNAYYRLDGHPVSIQIDEHHPGLDRLLEEKFPDYQNWVFITAYNPGSTIQSNAFNTKKQAKLLQLVRRKGYSFLPGEGGSPIGDWPAEKSLLIVDMPLNEAKETAVAFGQKAFVNGKKGGAAILIWL